MTIDISKMKALAAKLRRYAGSAFVVEAADAIDTLLAALESSTACCDSYASENQRLSDEAEAARAALEAAAADKRDAERYRCLRRGQHWSVLNGIGDTLRAEQLDDAIDAQLSQLQEEGS
ncbi:hypothetical protein [Burkholderia multivorans]|uniref:hypothetical protein n=1 Tax=Burkholderia multivorans TaxID=87883 RepID=UPI000D004BE8|nr:hypothetical protein [Burkholderia multivorans]PRE27572.1 hypothetical protein C6P79_14730 [Burkholderia multivorans]